MQNLEIFSIQNLYEYLKKKKYSAVIQNNVIKLSLNKLCNVNHTFNTVLIACHACCNPNVLSVDIKFNNGGYTDTSFSILYTRGYSELTVVSQTFVELFSIIFYNNLYETILGILLYMYNKEKRLILSIGYTIDFNKEHTTWKDIYYYNNGIKLNKSDVNIIGLSKYGIIKEYTIEVISKEHNRYNNDEKEHYTISIDSIDKSNKAKLEKLIQSVAIIKLFPYINNNSYYKVNETKLTNKAIAKLI